MSNPNETPIDLAKLAGNVMGIKPAPAQRHIPTLNDVRGDFEHYWLIRNVRGGTERDIAFHAYLQGRGDGLRAAREVFTERMSEVLP